MFFTPPDWMNVWARCFTPVGYINHKTVTIRINSQIQIHVYINNHIHRQAKIISASLRANVREARSSITLETQTRFYHLLEWQRPGSLRGGIPFLSSPLSSPLSRLSFSQACIFARPLYHYALSGI